MRGRDAHDERLTDEVHVEPRDELAVDVGIGRSAAGDEQETEKAQTHRTAHTASLAGFKADNRLQWLPPTVCQEKLAVAKTGWQMFSIGLNFAPHAEA